MYHRAKVDSVQDTDVVSRQFDDSDLSPVQAVWDTAVDTVSIVQQPYLDLMIAVVAVVDRPAVVGVNLDRNLNFDHVLADTVIDLWKYLSVVAFDRPATVLIVGYMDVVVVPILVALHMLDVVEVVVHGVLVVRLVVAVVQLVAAVVADHNYLRNDVVAAAVDATIVVKNLKWVWDLAVAARVYIVAVVVDWVRLCHHPVQTAVLVVVVVCHQVAAVA